jgi:hypothetical protein
MNLTFKKIGLEGFQQVADATRSFPSPLCDFSPFVIWAWRDIYKTEYAIIENSLVLKLTLDGEEHFAINSSSPSSVMRILLGEFGQIKLSLVTEEALSEVRENFDVDSLYTNDAWRDYVYAHSDIATLSGKRFSGQRNHINKFLSTHSAWSYEKVSETNIDEVTDFYLSLMSKTTFTSQTAQEEAKIVLNYLNSGWREFPQRSGLIRADGKVVAFSFGEIVGDTLFVHIEKASKEVQGAYPMIVREFARHNEAAFINREEDMGVEGLRTSKLSYHPVRFEKKYSITVK